ncbi:carboxypeptidase-like regulatory domain-containing protein [Geobacter pickeringii]|uniref:Uncharacterized protein n=1 Tax=Geobacter pickeringii TaxID=345632 RepID=A0A0B5BG06_9BACT|nr:carboxypeptidase-like regulatory domain-containing protein [Geobacter pickeringii]AJE04074.1 hypothetical protein GPICK_12530 [Geobacter pickeringii]
MDERWSPSLGKILLPAAIFIAALFLLCTGCTGPGSRHGSAGFLRPVTVVRACVAGRVTDAVTGRGVAGVALEVEPAGGVHPVTNQDGSYYAEFPDGTYRMRFARQGYRPAEFTVPLTLGETVARDVMLEPTAPVIVDAGRTVTDATPGSTVTLRATVTMRDGSTLKGIRWAMQVEEGGVAGRLSGTDGPVVRVTLPPLAAYKETLLYHLGQEGRLLDRWMVMGLVPSDLRRAGRLAFSVTAETTSGNYTDNVDIIADLRPLAAPGPGLRNVAIGAPLLLNGREQATYAWTLTPPDGSQATLRDAATRTPSFTPDMKGTYTVSEGGVPRLMIVAGRWMGVVGARDEELRPRWVGREGCLCHYNDALTPRFNAWRKSGHAEIFQQCLNTVFRYEERCFTCHTVGFGGTPSGAGISAVPAYEAFLKEPLIWDHGKSPPLVTPKLGNYDYLLDYYPDVARRANVQCENCHGPNNSAAHKTMKKSGAPERIAHHAEVCGVCHDESIEPSYRQWLASNHANYHLAAETVAPERGGRPAGECGRCHTAQGFLAWLDRGERAAPLGANTPFLTPEKVDPVTCIVCHDPHDAGNSFRSGTDKVPIRAPDATRMQPPALRDAPGGRGALCIICHSTDDAIGANTALPPGFGTPPHAPQGDVTRGINAFFVERGKPGSHARIEDGCIWCHVKPVPKAGQGYPRGGVSHSFKTAPRECSRCHRELDGEELLAALETDTEKLREEVEGAILAEIGRAGNVTMGNAGREGSDISLARNGIASLQLVGLRQEMGAEVADPSGGKYAVPLSRIRPGGMPLAATGTGQTALKAAWNYFLLKNDGSRGAHNPAFVREVLAATLTRLREREK